MSGRRILVLLPWYTPAFRAGGPIRTIAALVTEHGESDRFAILTGDRDWGESTPLDVPTDRWVDVGRARVRYCSSRGGHLASLRSWAWELARLRRPDVVYLNGVFPPLSSILPAALHRLGVLPADALVIAPRGEFSPGALRISKGRKRAFLVLAAATGLHRGAIWHASTPLEAGDIRRVLGDVRVIVRENETLLPEEPCQVGARRPGPLRVIFLSRVSEKKGLHVLLGALTHVATPIHVDVFGSSGDDAYWQLCRRLAEAARSCGHHIDFHGAVDHASVTDLFADADLFAFPTAGENFGHAIAESLCASTPVMARDTTPWTPLLAGGGGEIVDSADPEVWASRLRIWAALGPDELRRARRGAADAYRAWRAARPTSSVFDLIEALDRVEDQPRRDRRRSGRLSFRPA